MDIYFFKKIILVFEGLVGNTVAFKIIDISCVVEKISCEENQLNV